MRILFAGAAIAAVALLSFSAPADAGRGYRNAPPRGGCQPYNGPFGFYGNIWCQPTESQYLRNLGAQWPQPTPRSLRNPKPSSNYTW
jgi:hypothetical protein